MTESTDAERAVWLQDVFARIVAPGADTPANDMLRSLRGRPPADLQEHIARCVDHAAPLNETSAQELVERVHSSRSRLVFETQGEASCRPTELVSPAALIHTLQNFERFFGAETLDAPLHGRPGYTMRMVFAHLDDEAALSLVAWQATRGQNELMRGVQSELLRELHHRPAPAASAPAVVAAAAAASSAASSFVPACTCRKNQCTEQHVGLLVLRAACHNLQCACVAAGRACTEHCSCAPLTAFQCRNPFK
jgi:hypothetical protein